MSFKDFSEKKIIAYLPGRFDPFHIGHYNNYKILQQKFGKDNVYIGTSNKVDGADSPFTFEEKQSIIRKLFFIPTNKVIETKQPYSPKELLKNFSEDTIIVFGIGEKDKSRVEKSKYFEKYSDKTSTKGYRERAYYIILPNYRVTHKGLVQTMSSTLFRKEFSKAKTLDHQEEIFKEFYPAFNKKIFRLFVDVLGAKDYILKEGAAYGHLNHAYEVDTLTFNDTRKFITDVSKGNLKVSEKVDGINLLFTVIDGEIRFARSIRHLKNFGVESLTLEGLEEKFSDRPFLKELFSKAGKDLEKFVDSLSSEESEEFFKEGNVWINAEIVSKKNTNVILYKDDFIRLNSASLYDEEGLVKDYNIDLGNLYSKLEQVKTNYFKLQSAKYFYLKKLDDTVSFVESFDEIQFKAKKTGEDSITDVPEEIKDELDELFIAFGNYVIKNNFKMDKDVIKNILKRLNSAIEDIQENGTDKDKKFLEKELKRFEDVGGEASINSVEGIVINFKDQPLKLTGSFSPINKIINRLKYNK